MTKAATTTTNNNKTNSSDTSGERSPAPPKAQMYTPSQLRKWVQDAKQMYNITIVPEINVPGHAGGWGNKLPELIVQCPNFICEKGYGLALNITSPKLRTVLTNVIREVLDIFDNPPYLHLGGDEVTMSQPCFSELDTNLFNYTPFEVMLREIVTQDIGYPESQVIRWQTTGRELGHMPEQELLNYEEELQHRFGNSHQFWFNVPGETQNLTNYQTLKNNGESNDDGTNGGDDSAVSFFGSAGLYMDTNKNEKAWDVYVNSKRWLHLDYGYQTTGIIVGAFELDASFWYLRNMIGRLLAARLGASTIDHQKYHPVQGGLQFYRDYKHVCLKMGLDDDFCRMYGQPPIDYTSFRQSWSSYWKVWKDDICQRYTFETLVLKYKQVQNPTKSMLYGSRTFWDHLEQSPSTNDSSQSSSSSSLVWNEPILLPTKQQQMVENDVDLSDEDELVKTILLNMKEQVPNRHIGLVIDFTVDYAESEKYIQSFLSQLSQIFGYWMNLIQLRLVNDYAFAYQSSMDLNLYYAPRPGDERTVERKLEMNGKDVITTTRTVLHHSKNKTNTTSLTFPKHPESFIPDLKYLNKTIFSYASKLGIAVMPEVNLITDASGIYKGGYTVACPKHACSTGLHIPQNIADNGLVPFVYSIIRELYDLNTSPYFHLGSNERKANLECFQEAGIETPNYDFFERKLSKILELDDISTDTFIRWQSKEEEEELGGTNDSKSTATRLGSITQYRTTASPNRISRHNHHASDSKWFATVDLMDGRPSHIYETTRKWVEQKQQTTIPPPVGIIAEFGSINEEHVQSRHIWIRLLAFVLGSMTDSPEIHKDIFSSVFLKLCQAKLGVTLSDAEWVQLNHHVHTLKHERRHHQRKYICDERTYNKTEYIFSVNE